MPQHNSLESFVGKMTLDDLVRVSGVPRDEILAFVLSYQESARRESSSLSAPDADGARTVFTEASSNTEMSADKRRPSSITTSVDKEVFKKRLLVHLLGVEQARSRELCTALGAQAAFIRLIIKELGTAVRFKGDLNGRQYSLTAQGKKLAVAAQAELESAP